MIISEDKFLIALGLRIKTLREHKSLSQEDLANDCNIPKSQITRIEKAKVNTTVRTLVKIANALEIEFQELFLNVDGNVD